MVHRNPHNTFDISELPLMYSANEQAAVLQVVNAFKHCVNFGVLNEHWMLSFLKHIPPGDIRKIHVVYERLSVYIQKIGLALSDFSVDTTEGKFNSITSTAQIQKDINQAYKDALAGSVLNPYILRALNQ